MLWGVLPIWPGKHGNVSPLREWSSCSLGEPNLATRNTQCYMTADVARLHWRERDNNPSNRIEMTYHTQTGIQYMCTHSCVCMYGHTHFCLSLTRKYVFFPFSPAGGSIWRAGSSQWRRRYQCQLHRYAESRTLRQWYEFGIGLPALPGPQWDWGYPVRSAIQWVQWKYYHGITSPLKLLWP